MPGIVEFSATPLAVPMAVATLSASDSITPARVARTRALAIAGLVVAVVIAYANSLTAPFHFDDAAAVTNNATIHGTSPLAWLRPPTDGSTTTGRPLVNATFGL